MLLLLIEVFITIEFLWYSISNTWQWPIFLCYWFLISVINIVCFCNNSPIEKGPPLWSSDQSSWLQIQMSEFNSRCYHIFWEVVGLEWGPLSLVSTTEKLLERKSSGSGLENPKLQLYGIRCADYVTPLYLQKLLLTSLTSGHCSV
jgi:hypothetical protein